MAESGSPPRSGPSDGGSRRRRWPWILLGAALATVLGIRALLPLAVERGVAWGSRRYLGLPIRIDDVDLSLLRGGIRIDGLTIEPRPDGVTPLRAAWRPPAASPEKALLHWDRLAIRLSWLGLLHHTLHLTDLTVDAAETRLFRDPDGRIDPLRHAQPTQPRETPPPPPTARAPAPSADSPPWKIQVDRFALNRPGIHVVDAESGADVIRFSLEDLTLAHVAFQGESLSLGGVSLDGPVLRVRRDLFFGRTPTPDAPPPSSASAAPPTAARPGAGAAPGYRIDQVDIERAEFVWITDAGPVELALGLHASNVTAEPGRRFPIDLQLEIEQGRIHVHGQAGILPPAFVGSLTWSDLPLPPLALAAAPDLAHWLRACSSSGELKLDVDLAAKDRPDVTLSGRTSVDGLRIADRTGKEVSLGWKQLEIAIGQIAIGLPQEAGAPATTKVALDRLALVDPQIRYTRPSPALDALLAGSKPARSGSGSGPGPGAEAPAGAQAESTAPAAETSPAPVDLSLASLELSGASLDLLDRTVTPEARTRIRDLSVSARDLHYPQMAAQAVRLRATLPQRAALAVDGALRPGSGDLTLSLTRLDLPAFDPYASAAGATLSRGRASLDTRLRLRGEHLQADNELLLSQLDISLRDPGAFERRFGVPLDLALALLRDPSGDIRLSIPVELEKKDARISLGTVIASALRQALVGALTTPLKMGGAAFSGLTGGGRAEGISIEPVAAVPGVARIAEDQQGRVDGIARLLTSRPVLDLVLRGRTGPADRPGLAQQILAARVQAGGDLPSVEGAGFFARRRLRQALEKRARGEPVALSPEDQALYERTIAAVPVPDERLRALARERADALRALLTTRPGIEASRVTVGEPAADGPPAVLLGFEAR